MMPCEINQLDRSTRCEARMRALMLSTFPSRVQPVFGVFVKERARFVSQLPEVDIRVVSPIPYFPPIKWLPRWYPWSQVPLAENVDGIAVTRRRYFLPPKIGGYFHPRLMYKAAMSGIRAVEAAFDFNIIDAHFIYPFGVVATRVGRLLDKPVVITCRGEDIERFPEYPMIGPQIRAALKSATRLVAVSGRIADRMVDLGADAGKITVIPNGVDLERFQPMERDSARRQLGLPLDRPIILGVGYRLELKGFHLLIDALPAIRRRFPDVLVAIVGGEARWAPDYLPQIRARIEHHGVDAQVLLAGDRPQDELRAWYSAADVLSILSSREGSPNVLMEALACGLPAVATPVGGIPQLLADAGRGILLGNRTAEDAADGLVQSLSRNWDRAAIHDSMAENSWVHTANQVEGVFRAALGGTHGKDSSPARERAR